MNTNFNIPTEIKQLISANQAFHHRIIPVSKDSKAICFKTDAENNEQLKEELKILLGYEIQLEKVSTENLQSYLTLNYRQKTTNRSQTLNLQTDFLSKLLQTAKDYNSSDIHLEAFETKCRIRLRLDGKLRELFTVNKSEYPQLINQIKIKAGLDISQKRLSQDGRITVHDDKEDFDIRVSTLPTLHGEKAVLRILKRDTESVNLEDLGFTANELKRYLEAIKKPNGIILISGPTGSGKTTTLYGTLKILNEESRNIITIEDPIEYTLQGINQVQLKEDIGFDFPAALRTFLRQDPDIIMVGEIRDEKTATMAIKAALTGHLVFSTIHTNSAWSTVSRLIDMGIPPYLIAGTLNLSMAQRLIRLLCLACRQKVPVDQKLFPHDFEIPEDLTHHYISKGCPQCYHSGYLGRKAVYEIVTINEKIKQKIKSNAQDIKSIIEDLNLETLKKNAIRMMKNGETSIEEVYSLLSNTY